MAFKAKYDYFEYQVLGFANVSWRFIQGFSQIAALFTSMLRTIKIKSAVEDLRFVSENSTIDVIEQSLE